MGLLPLGLPLRGSTPPLSPPPSPLSNPARHGPAAPPPAGLFAFVPVLTDLIANLDTNPLIYDLIALADIPLSNLVNTVFNYPLPQV